MSDYNRGKRRKVRQGKQRKKETCKEEKEDRKSDTERRVEIQ